MIVKGKFLVINKTLLSSLFKFEKLFLGSRTCRSSTTILMWKLLSLRWTAVSIIISFSLNRWELVIIFINIRTRLVGNIPNPTAISIPFDRRARLAWRKRPKWEEVKARWRAQSHWKSRRRLLRRKKFHTTRRKSIPSEKLTWSQTNLNIPTKAPSSAQPTPTHLPRLIFSPAVRSPSRETRNQVGRSLMVEFHKRKFKV